MLARAVHTLTSAPLLRLVACAGVIGWTIAFAIHVPLQHSLVTPNGKPIGGDFVSGYAAGRLVVNGHGHELYDLRLQQQTQGRIVGRPESRTLCSFVNPPVVAVAFTPLALLPYRVAYLAYTGMLLAAFLLAFRILRPHLPALHDCWGTVVGLAFLLYPLAITITGGQNTAVTLLLMAAAYAALRRGDDTRAGVMVGLLFFKPQFALLLCLLLMLRRRYRCVLAAGAVAFAYYLVGALVCGLWWPLEMSRTLATYWPLEHQFNGMTSISLIGFCEAVLPAELCKPVGMTLAALLTAGLLWTWRSANPRDAAFPRLWALAVCATILVSPHTQWYDGGLVLLAVLLALNDILAAGQPISTNLRLMLLAGFCLVPLYSQADALGFQPVILLPTLTAIWLLELPRTAPRAAIVGV